MNTNLTTGILVFVIWSCASTWYYVCQIKGLCIESTPTITVEALKPVPIKAPDPEVMPIEPKLAPIAIYEDQIFFEINSTKFKNADVVLKSINDIKSQIADRSVEIKIEGSTCDLGDKDYNKALGLKRAQKVGVYFGDMDQTKANIKLTSVGEITSSTGTDQERQKNRKASITIKSTD